MKMPRAFLITNKRYNPNSALPTNAEDVENCPSADIPFCDSKTNRSVNSGINGSEAATFNRVEREFGGVPNEAHFGHLSPIKPSSSATPSHVYNRISVLTHTANTALHNNSCNILNSVHLSPYISKCALRAVEAIALSDTADDCERDISADEMQVEAQDLSVRNRCLFNPVYSDVHNNSTVVQSFSALSSPESPCAHFAAEALVEYSSSSSTADSVDAFATNACDNHICGDCGKRYSTSSNLARHRQTHRSVNDKKARKCPHCDKVYVSMPAYSMHVRTHSQGCQCPYCGKCFSRPWLLQGHIRTHTGEKPFKCPICAKAFADKSNLRAHIQTHSTTKPYSCQRCGKAFALKSYLYKHEESSCMRVHKASAGQMAFRNSVSLSAYKT